MAIAAAWASPIAAQPSATLERGVALYAKRDWRPASLLFASVVDGETGDDDGGRQRAEFFLAKTLYQLEHHAASLAYFERIARAGPAHRYHAPTLEWLAALARVRPRVPRVLEVIGRYEPAVLEQPSLAGVRDQLLYLFGSAAYDRGALDRAAALLGRVPASSPLHLRATLLAGAAQARSYNGELAAAAFRAILAAPPTPRTRRLAEIASLQLARIFYATRQWDAALKYYGRVRRTAPEYPDALYESAWSHLMMRRHAAALADLDAASAPYFNSRVAAAAKVLRAALLFERCLYRETLAAAAAIDSGYRARRAELDALVDGHPDDAELFEVVARRGGERQLEAVTALDRELALLEGADAAWKTSKLGTEILAELTLRRAFAVASAGKIARLRIERRARELGELRRDAVRLELEIREAGGVTGAAPRSTDSLSIDGGHPMWKLDRGFGRGPGGDVRLALGWACQRATPEPAPPPPPDDGAIDDRLEGELIKPDGTASPRRWDRPVKLGWVPRDFVLEMSATTDALRADGTL